jgi:hypothetical protein
VCTCVCEEGGEGGKRTNFILDKEVEQINWSINKIFQRFRIFLSNRNKEINRYINNSYVFCKLTKNISCLFKIYSMILIVSYLLI